jgi:hypothetical protein
MEKGDFHAAVCYCAGEAALPEFPAAAVLSPRSIAIAIAIANNSLVIAIAGMWGCGYMYGNINMTCDM